MPDATEVVTIAGQGPPPKPRNARARRNAERVTETVLRAEVVEPPELPEEYADCPEVVDWWQAWLDSPQADIFSSTDWAGLRETLPLVKAYYYSVDKDGVPNGLRWASEIRLREAAYGKSPADRARLRMSFVQASEAERKTTTGRETDAAKERYSGLRVVGENIPPY